MHEILLAVAKGLRSISLILTDDISLTLPPLNDALELVKNGEAIRAWQPSIAQDRSSMGR